LVENWLVLGYNEPRILEDGPKMTRQQGLFENVYKKDSLNFWAGQSLDYERVREVVGLSNTDLSRVAGVAKSSVRFDERIPPELKDRMEQIANCGLLVADYFGGDARKVAIWFQTPNPLLGGVSPRDMIRYGRFAKLQRFVGEALQNRSARASKTA
jgi:antitoxin Xre/MbcA/ParS-like protein